MRANEGTLQDLKIPSKTSEAHLAILFPLCSCWHGDLQHRQLSQHIIMLRPSRNYLTSLQQHVNLALNSRFPPVQEKKTFQEDYCHRGISQATALQGELTRDLTEALTSSHHILLFWKEMAGHSMGHSGIWEEGSASGLNWLEQVVLQVKG